MILCEGCGQEGHICYTYAGPESQIIKICDICEDLLRAGNTIHISPRKIPIAIGFPDQAGWILNGTQANKRKK